VGYTVESMKDFLIPFIRRAWNERVKFAKYVIVGVSSVAIDISLLIVCADILSINPTVSVVLSQAIVLTFNFTLNKKWSFGSVGKAHQELVRYLILATWNYVFSVSAMYVGNEQWGIHHVAVRVLSIACMVLWNFALFRFWVYRERAGEKE